MNSGKPVQLLAIVLGLLASWQSVLAATTLETDALRVELDACGQIVRLLDKASQLDYRAADQDSPLLQVRIDGKFCAPDRMTWNDERQQMTLEYGPVSAVVQVHVKPTYLTFELTAVEPLADVDRIQWGPIATRIDAQVGEVIGVVHNDTYAIGLQILNVKTLGGLSENEEGRTEARGSTALATPWGSALQAYSLDRSRPRNITVWGKHYPNMPVPPIAGETVLGSKIALFGGPADSTLARLGEIGRAEGLPHLEFDGCWSRTNPDMGRPYLIIEFSEANIAEILKYARQGGFSSVYHSSPFVAWGHYELRKDHFPRGKESMKACVTAAREQGMRIGVHTLTNFISTTDRYVTPTPDPRLAVTGSSRLVAGIDATQAEIEVAAPEYFANRDANWLRTVMIGEELIRYGAVSEQPPWKLLDCRRGAWGTKAAPHAANDTVGKLLDHPYQVFFPSYEMQHEIAVRLAELCNETGIGHLDFDGHEGCWATGQGAFALEMFAQVFNDHVNQPVLNGSSQILPFYWHINTNTNWGEPWYGGFRGSMVEYRLQNQALFRRNFMQPMMGWFQFSSETSLADIEWLMARNAGYGAGFALTTSLAALRSNPQTAELLAAIRNWDQLRVAGVLSQQQRQQMQDPANEFHLDVVDGKWLLSQTESSRAYQHQQIVRQPGEPTAAQWEYTTSAADQPLAFTLEVIGENGQIDQAVLELDNYARLEVPLVLKHGQTLHCDGSQTLRVFDAEGRQVEKRQWKEAPPKLKAGPHSISLACEFSGDPPPRVEVRFQVRGKPTVLPAP